MSLPQLAVNENPILRATAIYFYQAEMMTIPCSLVHYQEH